MYHWEIKFLEVRIQKCLDREEKWFEKEQFSSTFMKVLLVHFHKEQLNMPCLNKWEITTDNPEDSKVKSYQGLEMIN